MPLLLRGVNVVRDGSDLLFAVTQQGAQVLQALGLQPLDVTFFSPAEASVAVDAAGRERDASEEPVIIAGTSIDRALHVEGPQMDRQVADEVDITHTALQATLEEAEDILFGMTRGEEEEGEVLPTRAGAGGCRPRPPLRKLKLRALLPRPT
jgi:hypothetical protein